MLTANPGVVGWFVRSRLERHLEQITIELHRAFEIRHVQDDRDQSTVVTHAIPAKLRSGDHQRRGTAPGTRTVTWIDWNEL